jgi:hypothetical protein
LNVRKRHAEEIEHIGTDEQGDDQKKKSVYRHPVGELVPDIDGIVLGHLEEQRGHSDGIDHRENRDERENDGVLQLFQPALSVHGSFRP